MKIADQDFVLPLKTQVRSSRGRYLSLNEAEFHLYRTTATEDRAPGRDVPVEDGHAYVTIPARSLVTLATCIERTLPPRSTRETTGALSVPRPVLC